MTKRIKTKIILSTFFVGLSTSGTLAEFGPEYYYKSWRLPPYKTAIVSKGSAATKPLIVNKPSNSSDLKAISQAQLIVEDMPVLALILVNEQKQIIFESYGDGATKNSLIKGWSMTKSLVSLTLGSSVCDGTIKSLDDKANTYSTALQGNEYGNASIKDLLKMASGGAKPEAEGMPYENMIYALSALKKGSIRSSFAEFGEKNSNSSNKGTFTYKGLDTDAVSIAIADSKKDKFQNVFSKNIWSKIGAENNGEFVIDKNGDALAESGFGATARDWARLAIFVRDNQKNNGCYGDYMREATKAQISNRSEHGQAFRNYGYQFWTDNKLVTTPAAWLNGYGGQRIGIDLKSGKIVVMLSYKLGAVASMYKLFDEWTR